MQQSDLEKLKIAISYDFLIMYGGSEVVLELLMDMFPQAEIFTTSVWIENFPEEFRTSLSKHKVHKSRLLSLPFFKKIWKFFLPSYARYFQTLNLENYDLVISVSSSFSKWINVKKPKHIAFINTPPRFLWGLETSNLHKVPGFLRILLSPILTHWKNKDRDYACKADLVIANSTNIKSRIEDLYGVESEVIYPPLINKEINLDNINNIDSDYYLIINRLVKYKKIDNIIQLFNTINRKLIIVGDGPEREQLKRLATGNIEFKGFVTEEDKYRYLVNAKALIYPGEEDFGIGMVEALAYGKPILAFNGGGAREIVNEDTGILFDSYDVFSLQKKVLDLEKKNFDKNKIINRSKLFSREVFVENFTRHIINIFNT